MNQFRELRLVNNDIRGGTWSAVFDATGHFAFFVDNEPPHAITPAESVLFAVPTETPQQWLVGAPGQESVA